MYDETKDERDFELVADAITRVYRVKKGQGITIAKKHVNGEVAVSNLKKVSVEDSNKSRRSRLSLLL